MKKIMMETAQHICGREKKIKDRKLKRENSKEAWMDYKKCRQSAKRLFRRQRKRNGRNVQVI